MVTDARDTPARRTADVQLRGGLHARVFWPPPSGSSLQLLVLFAAGYALPGFVVLAACPDDVDQAMDIVGWAADHASELDASAAGLLVGGDPELAAAVAARAHERGWPPVELFAPGDEFRRARSS
jgi:hypothetical protein